VVGVGLLKRRHAGDRSPAVADDPGAQVTARQGGNGGRQLIDAQSARHRNERPRPEGIEEATHPAQ